MEVIAVATVIKGRSFKLYKSTNIKAYLITILLSSNLNLYLVIIFFATSSLSLLPLVVDISKKRVAQFIKTDFYHTAVVNTLQHAKRLHVKSMHCCVSVTFN